MKKLITMLAIALIGAGSTFAQTPTKKAATAKPTVAKSAAKATTPASTAKTKADGTLDMRYKENKESKKATGPTKKDGSLDMRYKANKTAPAKKQ